MRYVENMTTEEIAKHFGVPEACVQNWYHAVDAALADERNPPRDGDPMKATGALESRLHTYADRIVEGWTRGVEIESMIHLAVERPETGEVMHMTGLANEMLVGIGLLGDADITREASKVESGCMRIVLFTTDGNAVFWCTPEVIELSPGGQA
jgi:hypothetical protein